MRNIEVASAMFTVSKNSYKHQCHYYIYILKD